MCYPGFASPKLPEPRMKFICDRCQTRYSIADQKVRQKILRIRCKTCGNVVMVQEASPALAAMMGARSRPTRGGNGVPTAKPPAQGGGGLAARGKEAGIELAPRKPATLTPQAAGSPGRPAIPPPPPAARAKDPGEGRCEWYVAFGGVESGPFSSLDAAKRILALSPDETVHVWKDGMADWQLAQDVAVIAREIGRRGPAPPPPPGGNPQSRRVLAEVSEPAGRASAAAGSVVASKLVGPVLAPSGLARPSVPGPLAAPGPVAPAVAAAQAEAELAELEADEDFDEGAFTDIVTQKRGQGGAPAPSVDIGSPFAEVVTKKEKSRRDLEADPLPAPALVRVDAPPTPLPRPSAARAAARSEVAVTNLADSSTLPNSGSLALSGAESWSSAPAELATNAQVEDASVAALLASHSAAPGGAELGEAASVSGRLVALPAEVSGSWARRAEGLPSHPGLKYVVAALALVVLVLLLVIVSLRPEKRPAPAKVEAPAPAVATSEATKDMPEEPKAAPTLDEHHPGATHGGDGSRRGARTRSVGPIERRSSARSAKPSSGDKALPNPFGAGATTVSQDQISAIVRNRNNQAALKSCYERALKMDERLTSGRMDVSLSISASGVVERVTVNAPAAFFMVEPCIRLAVKRWVFPPSSEAYGTTFPLIMQGGM